MKVRIQLHDGGTQIEDKVIQSEAELKIGDLLDFQNCFSLRCEDQHERKTYLVTFVTHAWENGGLIPVVSATSVNIPLDKGIFDALIDRRGKDGSELWPWRS